jgi:hypothetical protein
MTHFFPPFLAFFALNNEQSRRNLQDGANPTSSCMQLPFRPIARLKVHRIGNMVKHIHTHTDGGASS